ncbi:hypothetical protein [Ancylobacter sp.]|uniref:hypothetical protein n=1 Tax=Ancylobacter sp. TaxID=1872567 RepID=UPI003C7C4916
MSDTQRLRALLEKRLEIVQQIGRLNARQLKNRQIFSGLDLEVMRCERDLLQRVDAAVTDGLADVRLQYGAALAALAEDERDLMEWYGRLDALDREISKQ